MNKIFIGIDVSKATLDIFVKHEKETSFLKIKNNKKDISKFLNQYDSLLQQQVYLAMENTGWYNFNLYEALKSLNFQVYVVSPLHIKRSIGLVRGKSDKIDACRICFFIEKNFEELEQWVSDSDEIRELKLLMSRRRSLVKNKRRITNQLKEYMGIQFNNKQSIIKDLKRDIKRLDKDIQKTEQLLKQTIDSNAELKKNNEILKSIPGVGDISAWLFIEKTNGFTRLMNPRKLGCFTGVVPFSRSSGTSVKSGNHVSNMADKSMKTILHMAAMRAIRLDCDFKVYYERKVQEGKNKMSVLNAIRNKIIHVAIALIKNQSFYQNRLVLS